MTNTAHRILVVDDSKMIRMKIREELEEGGYQVVEAQNGLEALSRLASDVPPDLVTLDIDMPKMNGFETCRRLRTPQYTRFLHEKSNGHIPVVFITANDTITDRTIGFDLGAVDFLAKPFHKGDVLSIVDKILRPQASQNIHALVVDDSHVDRKMVSQSLSGEGIDVIEAEDGLHASSIIAEKKDSLDIVITDLIMPGLDGLQLCRKIRQEFAMPDIPIIVLTGIPDLSELLKVFHAGATDYLVKPYAKEELLARVGAHTERSRINRQLREKIYLLKNANESVHYLSVHDPLTKCYNRIYLDEQIQKEIQRAVRYSRPLSVVFADIDHFKNVNDVHGHQVGDKTLVWFATAIEEMIRKNIDWTARYGGEEFVIVMPETDVANAVRAAEKLRGAVEFGSVNIGDKHIRITSSFGVAGFTSLPAYSETIADMLLKKADAGCYEAKKSGRNKVVVGS
jgi:two-component system cell cycle response regulator